MEWITDTLPTDSGNYIVSIKWQRPAGIILFMYFAHYVKEQDVWYKYDPFDNHYKPSQEVEGEITAWAKDIGPYYV